MEKKSTYLSFWEKIAIKILRTGHIPEHIAFIMDGNRRYAKSLKQQTKFGHQQGLESLKHCLEWCLELGVKEVTTFAFSIENFSRSKEEVNCLMQLAKDGLEQISRENEFLQLNQIKVLIRGDLDLLPEDVHKSMIEVMSRTQSNTKLLLNICFSYSGNHELLTALNQPSENYTIKEFLSKLEVKTMPDIMMRTSGVRRLSNFLIFQSTSSELEFIDEFWPALGMRSFLKMILDYQRNEKELKSLRKVLNLKDQKIEQL